MAMRQRGASGRKRGEEGEDGAASGRTAPPARAGLELGRAPAPRVALSRLDRRSTVSVHGWWHTEDLKIYSLMAQRKYWIGVWQHLAFPLVWLSRRSTLQRKLKELDAKPSTRKLAKDAAHKTHGFLLSHLTFSASFVIWQYGKIYVHEEGDAWTDMETAGQLVQNISLALPAVVYVLFYSGISQLVFPHIRYASALCWGDFGSPAAMTMTVPQTR